MSISVVLNQELSRYEIFTESELAGFAEFRMRGNTIVFPHTEIDPKFGGKGLGSSLIEYALNEALAKNYQVAPYCPFVSKYIGKHSEQYLHLVPEADRAKFNL